MLYSKARMDEPEEEESLCFYTVTAGREDLPANLLL